MSEPNAKDRELAEQFVYYLCDESDLEEGDDLPVAMDIATYRLEIEAATRARVLAEVEAFRDSCADYMVKSVWRELNTLIVSLGGESKEYVWKRGTPS